MTDQDALCEYRLKLAEETLEDAQKMLQSQTSARSIINRAYYATFYAALGLFIKESLSINTSKHTGVIACFDKEFVHTGKIDKKYSRIIHRLFDSRQEVDYREFVNVSSEEAKEFVALAKEFVSHISTIVRS